MDQEHKQTRDMVMVAALALSIETAEVAQSKDMLACSLEEHVEAGEALWHLTCHYREDGVRIMGHVHGELPPHLANLFGQECSSFDYWLPLDWARRAHMTHQPVQ